MDQQQADYSRQEAWQRLGVCEDTLDRLIRLGVLAGYRIGRRVRVTRESVELYLASCRERHPVA